MYKTFVVKGVNLLPIKTTTTTTTAIFHCSLERAFKTPILGDATKTLTGYGVIPPVTHFTQDKTWGKVGGSRIPHSASNILSKGGEVGFDVILVREENKYWKWELKGFRQWSMGFTKFQGELFFDTIDDHTVEVKWVYTLYSKPIFLYPFHWLFTKIIWKRHMDKAIKRMKLLAEGDGLYVYE